MLPPRPHASNEMVAGYRETARLALERAEVDPTDAVEWRKVAAHYEMCANCRYVDPPDSRVNFYALDERIRDPAVIVRILTDLEDGGPTLWTQDHSKVIGDAVRILSGQQRKVTSMFYLSSVKRHDIAHYLRLSIETVDVHLRDARAKWRAWRERLEAGEPVQVTLMLA